MKTILRLAASIAAVLLLAGGAFALNIYKQKNLVLPRTVVGDMDLSGLSYDEAREHIRKRLRLYLETPIQIAARGEVQQLTLSELGIVLNEAVVLDSIPFAGRLSNPEILLWSIAGRRVIPDILVERTEVLKAIDDKFPSIPKTRNAHLVKSKKGIEVVEAVKGATPNIDSLLGAVRQNIVFLEHTPLIVEFTDSPPDIVGEDLEQHKDLVIKHFPKTVTLASDQKKWDLNFEMHPEWIAFDRKIYEIENGEMPFSMSFEPLAFAEFVSKNVASFLEQAPEDISIWSDSENKIQFDGRGTDGKAIENEELLSRINKAIANNESSVEIPIAVLPAKIEISEELQKLGIRDLLSTGYTRFEGSPVNRAFNIGVAINRFNGVLIPPGEVFSFGDALGPVDGSTGYRKELVIKPEGTIPEYGGGVCQVSSTMFRAALFSGLPIIERKPHSYAVMYYAQVGGHGLDATVYPPSPDLKFKNDTPGHILIHSYVDGPSAYFKFYGTKDSRTVTMEGPYISNKRYAPAEPVLVPDINLAPGQRKQVEKAHSGFDALWYRHLTKDGQTIKEEIVSRYKATPNKFLVGGDVEPAPSSDVPVNPFE